MDIDVELVYNQVQDTMQNLYKTQNITETICDALTNCLEEDKSGVHVLPVAENLKDIIDNTIDMFDMLDTEIVKLLN